MFRIILMALAPAIVIFLTQILKRWISTRWSPLIVLALGGISALIGVGPTPGEDFIENTINVAWVSGFATLIYDIFKKLKGTKTTKTPIILLALMIAVSMTACASFDSNTYKTMYTLGTTYDAAMKSANELYKQGKLSGEDAQKIMIYANAYYVSYQEAVVAFEVYRKTKSEADKNKLAVILGSLAGKHAEIIGYIERLKN